ncbi:MAG: hypothetical protein IJW36_00930 [Clostridia bacterium]|nr:hypothetical protein [Clostridia bacterium]
MKKFYFKLILKILYVLLVLPAIVLPIMFHFDVLNSNDWGNLTCGLLTYLGTIILGIVTTTQTNISLKQADKSIAQTEKTFKSDKYSIIKFTHKSIFEILPITEDFKKNIYEYPVNQFVVYEKDGQFTEKALAITLKYKADGHILNDIKLKNFSINYCKPNRQPYFIDTKVKTDLCETPETDDSQIEIILMCSKGTIEEINELLNKGYLLLNLSFEIKSASNVIVQENVTINYGDTKDKKIVFKETPKTRRIGNISYNYIQKED